MKSQTLRPQKETLEINGKLSYRESLRAWNTIRFKKELIAEFPALKDRTARFGYTLVLHRDFASLEQAIRKLKRENGAIPILLNIQKLEKVF